MYSKTQLLSLSTLTVIFVALVYWYAGDLVIVPAVEPATNSWPEDGVDREPLDWIEESWNLDKFPAASGNSIFRFWYMASFDDSYIATVNITSHVSASVTVTTLTSSVEPLRENFTGALSQSQIDELLLLLDSVDFWNTPPGPLGWTCIDGENFVAETNIGDQYRVWGNACEASPAMSPIAGYFHRTVSRIVGEGFGRL